MPERRDSKGRRVADEISTSPIRWDRVDSMARRKRLLIVAALALASVGLTVAVVVVAFAGKTAIDPSFSPPILSGTSASIDVEEPRMGWALVARGENWARGYVVKAGLDVEGLRGDVLVPHWSIRAIDAPRLAARGGDALVTADPITPDSDDDQFALRRWVLMPEQMGRYVSEVWLTTLDGRTVAEDRSAPFFVIGKDCCRRYETDLYVAPLPRRWSLREDFEPYPDDRHVTLAIGPFDNSLVIDTSVIDPENIGKTALPFQEKEERRLAKSELGYSPIGKRVFRAPDGEPVVEWSYRLEGNVLTDILFFRGPSGFAVLGRSGNSHFRETRDLTRLVARSLQAKKVPD